jgi:hypothetical protein
MTPELRQVLVSWYGELTDAELIKELNDDQYRFAETFKTSCGGVSAGGNHTTCYRHFCPSCHARRLALTVRAVLSESHPHWYFRWTEEELCTRKLSNTISYRLEQPGARIRLSGWCYRYGMQYVGSDHMDLTYCVAGVWWSDDPVPATSPIRNRNVRLPCKVKYSAAQRADTRVIDMREFDNPVDAADAFLTEETCGNPLPEILRDPTIAVKDRRREKWQMDEHCRPMGRVVWRNSSEETELQKMTP